MVKKFVEYIKTSQFKMLGIETKIFLTTTYQYLSLIYPSSVC